MRKNIVYILVALIAALPMSAQKLYQDALRVTDVSLWQQGDLLYVNMKIDMKSLKVSSQRSLTLTPLLTDGTHNIPLQEIMINGRRRQKAYVRGLTIEKKSPTATVIPYDKRGVLTYTQEIPYQAWMDNASLYLVEDLCGCGNSKEMTAQELITSHVSTEAKRLATLKPIVAYIQPPVETVKARSEQCEAYLDFPVNRYEIRAEFMNNREELTRIHAMFDKIQGDKDLTINGIAIEGFASPEGPLKANELLSRKRAEALKTYLTANEKAPADLYTVSFGGENWDGLVKALKASSMKDKEAFINLIRHTRDEALRKKELMRADGGAPYRIMLKEIYPKLRKVICKIDYTVANFDVQKGRAVIKTNPQHLSLNEMYRVANSYPMGSDDFANVFDIALRTYPNDETASLNAAAVALSRKDLVTAERLMKKANKQTAEYMNNRGVYDLLNGNATQAANAFAQAARMGNNAAKANLKQLQEALNKKKM